MKRLKQYFKGYLKESILGPFFKLLEAFFELLTPVILAFIIDDVIPNKNSRQLSFMILLLFLLSIVGFGIAITAQYFSSKAAVGITKELTDDLFKKIMSLPKKERDKIGSGSLVTRLTSDTFQIQTGINQFLRLFLRAPIIVFGSILMAFHLNKSLSLWFVLMVFVLFGIIYLVSHVLDPILQRVRLALDNIVTTVQLQLEGSRVIRAFNQLVRSENKFDQQNQTYFKLQLHSTYIANLISPLTYLVVNTILVLVIWQGNHFVSIDAISQGTLVALVNYLLQILTELLKLTILVSSLNQSFISLSRIEKIANLPSEKSDQKIVYNNDLTSGLSVCQLSFTYPSAKLPSIRDLEFQLDKGKFMGVIGGTGSGKSTLAQILVRLYPVSTKMLSLFYNGTSPTTISEWREWVGLVPQKAELFKGSIRYNLTLGSNEISEDAIWKALEIAQAKEFVLKFDNQLDEELEAFGRNLSGGQRQRLTIARTLLKKPKLLILDDSTSALDYVTETRLLKALLENCQGTSLILISQRIRALEKADTILVLDKGKQVGYGNHNELLKDNRIYREIYQSQQVREVN